MQFLTNWTGSYLAVAYVLEIGVVANSCYSQPLYLEFPFRVTP